MIKSPLRYPGGKSRAVKVLVPQFKGCKDFREPFVGGGSVSIHLAQTYTDSKIWINDLNYSVYAFWQKAIYDNEKVVDIVNNYYNDNSPELYAKLISLDTNGDRIMEAARFFALNRITFSGTTESGGYSKQAHKLRFTLSSIERLKSINGLKSKAIKITNCNYKESLDYPGEDVFIFLDPPYVNAEKSKLYGKNGNLHTGFNHLELYNDIVKCPHKWLITYDNCDYIKELYSEYNKYTWTLQYGMTNKKSELNNELIISNYELPDLTFLTKL